MLNTFLLSPQEKISEWRNFRKSLESLTLKEALETIVHWFAMAPVGKWGIDPYEPTSWPSPWELFYDEYWNKSSLAFLMHYTITLMENFKDGKITSELILIHDIRSEQEDIYLAVLVNDEYLLNFDYAEVVKFDKVATDLLILQSYQNLNTYKV